MTKEQLAALITGREYGEEISREEEAQARAAGLLVIFGASDDLTELRGALNDEAGAYDGAVHRIDRKGFIPTYEEASDNGEEAVADYFKRKDGGIEVRANWAQDDYSWVIETDVPHASFEIVEGDEKYCRGIVVAMADLG